MTATLGSLSVIVVGGTLDSLAGLLAGLPCATELDAGDPLHDDTRTARPTILAKASMGSTLLAMVLCTTRTNDLAICMPRDQCSPTA